MSGKVVEKGEKGCRKMGDEQQGPSRFGEKGDNKRGPPECRKKWKNRRKRCGEYKGQSEIGKRMIEERQEQKGSPRTVGPQ